MWHAGLMCIMGQQTLVLYTLSHRLISPIRLLRPMRVPSCPKIVFLGSIGKPGKSGCAPNRSTYSRTPSECSCATQDEFF
jgi:hypothetical protein